MHAAQSRRQLQSAVPTPPLRIRTRLSHPAIPMSTTTVLAAATADTLGCAVVPMFVCAGCRAEPLGYAILDVGDPLDEIVACPMREVCTWHAAHDLGGRHEFLEYPDAAVLAPLFRSEPYFSCPNFHEHARFLAGNTTLPAIVMLRPTSAEMTQGSSPTLAT